MRFEVHPGADGRWLVIHGARRYVVPSALGRRLRRGDGDALWRTLAPGASGTAPPRRALWLRLVLAPAGVVHAGARHLAPLASTPALLLQALLGVGGALAAPAVGPVASAADWWAAAALVVASGLWHELGHAAALAREGWRPGAVGVGLLWVMPVLWSDVSAAALLRRGGRVRVDLAGVGFQLGFVGCLGPAAALLDWPAGTIATRGVLLAVAWSLLPVVRSDGHWLACDLLGLAELAAPPPDGTARAWRLVLAGWRVMTATAIVAFVVALPWRVASLVLRAADGPLAVAGLAILAVLAGLGAARAWRRVADLLQAAWRDLRLGW